MEGWEKVESRKKRHVVNTKQWDNIGRSRSRAAKEEVTSFRDGYSSKDMYEVFNQFGVVDEVVILGKLDKQSRRDGFVRYFDVKDPIF